MSELQILNNLKDLLYLRNLYGRNSLKTKHGFYTLNNFIKWFELNQNINNHIKVYVFNNWKDSGMFIIEDIYHLFINSLTTNDEDVAVALKQFDWSRSYKITALPAYLFNIVDQTLQELNLNTRQAALKIYQRDPAEIMEDINCPVSLDLRPLSTSDANKINGIWYSRQDGSLEFFKSLINYNISLGLYVKNSNELVAWCTRCQCGFLGTLHVIENYRGQGLAKLLINAACRKVSEVGDEPRVMIHESNIISKNLFENLGFKFCEKVFIIRCDPKI